MVRELGLYLTIQGSKKSFVIPYANGDIPKPAFTGYTSCYAKEIESFLESKRSAGLKYRHEEPRLKDFDEFYNGQPYLPPQQLAAAFLHSQEGLSCSKGRRSASVIKGFGKYLNDSGCPNTFTIVDKNHVAGPYTDEIEAFVAFKKSCGYKYLGQGNLIKRFDVFCATEENRSLTPQQLADKWVLKKDGEPPNTRAGRVGPVRVFGKYLTSIGHPKAFMIADDAAQGGTPKPPYLFTEDDIEELFTVCSVFKPDEKDPSKHIVIPAELDANGGRIGCEYSIKVMRLLIH